MGIEFDTNNPLGLTTAGPGYSTGFTYPGQVGTQTSAYGYTFAQFPDQRTGIAAGIDYIGRMINSGRATTASALANLFAPSDLGPFEQTTGLSANSPLSAVQAPLYAAGIAAGEGTLSAFGGVPAFTGGAVGGASGAVNDWGGGTSPNTGAGAGGAPGAAGAASGGGWLDPLKAWIAGSAQNVVFVIVGIVVLLMALYMLANRMGAAPDPAELAKGVTAAALA